MPPRLRAGGEAAERGGTPAAAHPLRGCPRCGYRGEGLPYFARGSHVAALVGATVLTAGAMGAGGLVYYLVRRDHRICPRCGHGWGKYGDRALPVHREDAGAAERPRPHVDFEGVKRAWSTALFVMAALLLLGGLAEMELAPMVFAAAAAAGGVLLRRAAESDREKRRTALLHSLQQPVLQMAAQRGGRLTVTQVAAELGWPLRRAEKVLQSMDDGLRVDSEVTDEGVIEYQFRELLRAPEPGSDPRRLADPDA